MMLPQVGSKRRVNCVGMGECILMLWFIAGRLRMLS
jgi:hypothetical protein